MLADVDYRIARAGLRRFSVGIDSTRRPWKMSLPPPKRNSEELGREQGLEATLAAILGTR